MLNKFITAGALLICGLAAPAYADGGLSFVINGNTLNQPFSIKNTSTAGERVLSFGLTLRSGYLFDTVVGGNNNTVATPFAPVSGAAATGFYSPLTVADDTRDLLLRFNDFDPNETFSWDIDVDGVNGVYAATVYGNDLIGSTAFVDFSNGLRALGTLAAVPGSAESSAFTVTSVTPTPPMAAAAPEPATWGMMLFGFGLAGAVLRRRVRSSEVRFNAKIMRISEGAAA